MPTRAWGTTRSQPGFGGCGGMEPLLCSPGNISHSWFLWWIFWGQHLQVHPLRETDCRWFQASWKETFLTFYISFVCIRLGFIQPQTKLVIGTLSRLKVAVHDFQGRLESPMAVSQIGQLLPLQKVLWPVPGHTTNGFNPTSDDLQKHCQRCPLCSNLQGSWRVLAHSKATVAVVCGPRISDWNCFFWHDASGLLGHSQKPYSVLPQDPKALWLSLWRRGVWWNVPQTS